MIILRSAITRPMQRAMRGLLIIAVVIFLSWIASSWINYEAHYTAKPKTAKAFVQWWLSKALDYSPDAAKQHKEAEAWMLPAAFTHFDETFWTNSEVREFIITGISEPVVKKRKALVRVTGKWKHDQSETSYRDLELNFTISKKGGNYRISDWSVEKGMIYYHIKFQTKHYEEPAIPKSYVSPYQTEH